MYQFTFSSCYDATMASRTSNFNSLMLMEGVCNGGRVDPGGGMSVSGVTLAVCPLHYSLVLLRRQPKL